MMRAHRAAALLVLLVAASLILATWLRGGTPQPDRRAPDPASPRQRTEQQRPPATALAGQVWTDPVTGVEMVFVPAGEFIFGAPSGARSPLPKRTATVGAFWIGRREVTNAEYRAFVQATGRRDPYWWHHTRPGGFDVVPERDPPWSQIAGRAVRVDWADAVAFCRWAGMDLPTEEEWEKAARGTDGRRYPWGNKWLAKLSDGHRMNPRLNLSTIDVSPYGCVDMLLGGAGEHTRTLTDTGKAIAKGSLLIQEGPILHKPRNPALWLRRIEPKDQSEAGFRCVIRVGP